MSPKNNADPSKKKFLLKVKEALIGNNTVGYYFYFKKKVIEEVKQVYLIMQTV